MSSAYASNGNAAKLWEQAGEAVNIDGGNAKDLLGHTVDLVGGNATNVCGKKVLIGGGNATLVIAFKSVDLGGGKVGELHCLKYNKVEACGGTLCSTKYHTESDLVLFAVETLGLTL